MQYSPPPSQHILSHGPLFHTLGDSPPWALSYGFSCCSLPSPPSSPLPWFSNQSTSPPALPLFQRPLCCYPPHPQRPILEYFQELKLPRKDGLSKAYWMFFNITCERYPLPLPKSTTAEQPVFLTPSSTAVYMRATSWVFFAGIILSKWSSRETLLVASFVNCIASKLKAFSRLRTKPNSEMAKCSSISMTTIFIIHGSFYHAID